MNPSHQAVSLSLCMVLIKLPNLHLTKDKSNICSCFIFSLKNTLLSHIFGNDPSDEVSVFGSYVTSGYIWGYWPKIFFLNGSADLFNFVQIFGKVLFCSVILISSWQVYNKVIFLRLGP